MKAPLLRLGRAAVGWQPCSSMSPAVRLLLPSLLPSWWLHILLHDLSSVPKVFLSLLLPYHNSDYSELSTSRGGQDQEQWA